MAEPRVDTRTGTGRLPTHTVTRPAVSQPTRGKAKPEAKPRVERDANGLDKSTTAAAQRRGLDNMPAVTPEKGKPDLAAGLEKMRGVGKNAVIRDGKKNNPEHVKGAQTALSQLTGKDGKPYLDPKHATGQFNKETKEAIKKFQRENGLKEDGKLGPDTMKRMQEQGQAQAKGDRDQLGEEADAAEKVARESEDKAKTAQEAADKGLQPEKGDLERLEADRNRMEDTVSKMSPEGKKAVDELRAARENLKANPDSPEAKARLAKAEQGMRGLKGAGTAYQARVNSVQRTKEALDKKANSPEQKKLQTAADGARLQAETDRRGADAARQKALDARIQAGRLEVTVNPDAATP